MAEAGSETGPGSDRRLPPVRLALILGAGLMTLLLFWLSGRLRLEVPTAVRIVGVAWLLGALPLAFLPMFTLKRVGLPEAGSSYMDTTRLVETGPFALVRHPQYLAYMFIDLGLVLLSLHPVVIVLGAAAISGFFGFAVLEEKDLRARFGSGWDRYAAAVPRFNLPLGLARSIRRRSQK